MARAQMILQVPYEDIQRGLSEKQLRTLKKTGVIIVKGGVPREVSQCIPACRLSESPSHTSLQEALNWMNSIKDYVALNAEKVKGQYMPLLPGLKSSY